MDNRNFIAKRAAAYFRPGDVVNLGIGIPSLCGSYAVDGVLFQSENGFIGIGPSLATTFKTAGGGSYTGAYVTAAALAVIGLALSRFLKAPSCKGE